MSAPTLHQPVVLLSRRVRFAVNRNATELSQGANLRTESTQETAKAPVTSALDDQYNILSKLWPNSFAGRPSITGWGQHYELMIRCCGALGLDQQYVQDIKLIDRVAHRYLIPAIASAANNPNGDDASRVLANEFWDCDRDLAGSLKDITLHLSPTYSVMFSKEAPRHITLRQRFDFAAAHRLHNTSLSDQANITAFGKCNNPRGHGHNYQFEPAVRVNITDSESGLFMLHHLESAAQRCIIDRFDHTHLNEDTKEFNTAEGGLIPTVENIAYVFYALLREELGKVHQSAVLISMTVWETDRTSATYP